MSEMPWPKETCHLYIIAHSNNDGPTKPVKVGITANLNSRLKMLQTGNPGKLQFVMTLAMPIQQMARDMEQAFHHLQKDRRLAGEWFDIEVREAMALMCLYFDTAIMINIGDEDDADEVAKNVREYSGLNAMRAKLRGALQ